MCEWRDRQIVHDFHPRKLDCLTFTNAFSDVAMSYSIYEPKETDGHANTKTWGELIETLERYLWATLRMIQENRSVSRFANQLRPVA
jgi:hypothetical protein